MLLLYEELPNIVETFADDVESEASAADTSISCVACTNDILFVGCSLGVVLAYSRSGKFIGQVCRARAEVTSLVAEETLLVVGTSQGDVSLFDINRHFDTILTVNVTEGAITAVSFAQDIIYVGDIEGHVFLIDPMTRGSPPSVVHLDSSIVQIECNRKGNLLVSTVQYTYIIDSSDWQIYQIGNQPRKRPAGATWLSDDTALTARPHRRLWLHQNGTICTLDTIFPQGPIRFIPYIPDNLTDQSEETKGGSSGLIPTFGISTIAPGKKTRFSVLRRISRDVILSVDRRSLLVIEMSTLRVLEWHQLNDLPILDFGLASQFLLLLLQKGTGSSDTTKLVRLWLKEPPTGMRQVFMTNQLQDAVAFLSLAMLHNIEDRDILDAAAEQARNALGELGDSSQRNAFLSLVESFDRYVRTVQECTSRKREMQRYDNDAGEYDLPRPELSIVGSVVHEDWDSVSILSFDDVPSIITKKTKYVDSADIMASPPVDVDDAAPSSPLSHTHHPRLSTLQSFIKRTPVSRRLSLPASPKKPQKAPRSLSAPPQDDVKDEFAASFDQFVRMESGAFIDTATPNALLSPLLDEEEPSPKSFEDGSVIVDLEDRSTMFEFDAADEIEPVQPSVSPTSIGISPSPVINSLTPPLDEGATMLIPTMETHQSPSTDSAILLAFSQFSFDKNFPEVRAEWLRVASILPSIAHILSTVVELPIDLKEIEMIFPVQLPVSLLISALVTIPHSICENDVSLTIYQAIEALRPLIDLDELLLHYSDETLILEAILDTIVNKELELSPLASLLISMKTGDYPTALIDEFRAELPLDFTLIHLPCPLSFELSTLLLEIFPSFAFWETHLSRYLALLHAAKTPFKLIVKLTSQYQLTREHVISAMKLGISEELAAILLWSIGFHNVFEVVPDLTAEDFVALFEPSEIDSLATHLPLDFSMKIAALCHHFGTLAVLDLLDRIPELAEKLSIKDLRVLHEVGLQQEAVMETAHMSLSVLNQHLWSSSRNALPGTFLSILHAEKSTPDSLELAQLAETCKYSSPSMIPSSVEGATTFGVLIDPNACCEHCGVPLGVGGPCLTFDCGHIVHEKCSAFGFCPICSK